MSLHFFLLKSEEVSGFNIEERKSAIIQILPSHHEKWKQTLSDLDFQTSFSHVLDDPIASWFGSILGRISSGFSLVGTVLQNYKHELHFYSRSQLFILLFPLLTKCMTTAYSFSQPLSWFHWTFDFTSPYCIH